MAAAQRLASREKLYRQSVLLVEQVFFGATGLWPVHLGSVFHSKKNGPQGRGYNGYSETSSSCAPSIQRVVPRSEGEAESVVGGTACQGVGKAEADQLPLSTISHPRAKFSRPWGWRNFRCEKPIREQS